MRSSRSRRAVWVVAAAALVSAGVPAGPAAAATGAVAPSGAAASRWLAGRFGTNGFTLVDTATGAVVAGGAADTPLRTASVIKVPIAMTFLAKLTAEGRRPDASEQADLRAMLTRSDNDAATRLWDEAGGSAAVLAEMRALGATRTSPNPGRSAAWGFTLSTARDLATVTAALATGAPDPASARVVLDLMHQVVPSQRWGIGAAVPGAAVKNGWYPDPGVWRVTCLGVVSSRYALAVTTRYPARLHQAYGEATCAGVAGRLLPGARG